MPDLPPPGAPIAIPTAPNLRDVGGWRAADGRLVVRGVLYRSAELSALQGEDLAAFAALKVSTVLDLRTAGERDAQPDSLPEGVQTLVADVLADSEQSAPAQMEALFTDPLAATAVLGEGRATGLLAAAYRDIITLPSALSAYRLMFTTLLDTGRRPALFHCTTGKDRTGWGAAAMLLLLGVPEQDVRTEYLLTNEQLLPALTPLFERFAEAGGDPDLLRPVLGVRAEYLQTALDEMRSRFGSIEGYFTDGLGIERDGQEQLRDQLLTGADGAR